MSLINCEACEELRESAADFMVNGLSTSECTSLQNNTGLDSSSGNDDCEDLSNLNDCIVGGMDAEVDSYNVCDWKTFAHAFIPNVWTVFKGIICAICGLWTKVDVISYVGILTLYRTSTITDSTNADTQTLAFNTNTREGNIDEAVLQPTSDYKGIIIDNTTSVPLLVDTRLNCSIRTTQHLASCYVVITRDGTAVGQTPFITPSTYDQQVAAEAFILDPGETATMRYYFAQGDANAASWFKTLFYPDGSEDAHLCLEYADPSDVENQPSYFKVKVTSVVA